MTSQPTSIPEEMVAGARLAWRAIPLCALVAILDGFDMQAIAFVAPAIADDFGSPLSAFGPVFAMALVGIGVGAILFGTLADRIGRKPVIVMALALFGLCSFLSAAAQDVTQLLLARFATGVGLGAAIPNVIALTSEYAPERRRAMLIVGMYCGVPVGAVVGGFLSATWLLPSHGWRSVFLAGGIAPLLLLLPVILFLPESARFLVGRRAIGMTASDAVPPPRASVTALFTQGRARGTLALWIAFLANLLVMHFLISWLPAALEQAGIPLERAILGTVVLNLGGIIGGAGLAYLVDRRGPYGPLVAAYTLGALFMVLIGWFSDSAPLALGLIFFAGAGIIGGQLCMNALAAGLYPTGIRATGVGWAMAIGRLGSVLGSVAGGIMIALDLTLRMIFLVTAIPALVAALAILFMMLRPGTGAGFAEPVS